MNYFLFIPTYFSKNTYGVTKVKLKFKAEIISPSHLNISDLSNILSIAINIYSS